MTTATAPLSAPARTGDRGRVTFGHVVTSEWIKLRSLRSTVWSYAIVIAMSLGLGVILALNTSPVAGIPAAAQASTAVTVATFGVFFGQLVIAVLGVLVISGEYGTGMIRSTFTAVPRRLPALWAKAVVLFVSSFVVGLIAALVTFAATSPILANVGIHASLFNGDVIMPIIGSAFYLAVVSIFALGVGTILRASAGGISAALGLILLLPIIFSIAPVQWMHDAANYLIMNAGLAIFGLGGFGGPSPLDTWQQILVVLVWTVVSLGGAAILLKRKDA